MGRLHYTNRKIGGRKLAQVVNKDLVKRIPPNAGSRAAFRDPIIDIDLSGKALTDECFLEVASALVEALKYDGSQGRCTRLDELSLKDNGLSLASLQALTPIVKLACHDLRDLDLSGNQVQIQSEDDVAIWEHFLSSFEQCCSLRRFDLSGNALGSRAFETLLRVYAKEKPIDLILSPRLEQGQDEVQSPFTNHLGQRLRKISLVSESEEHSGDHTDDSTSSKRRGSRHDTRASEISDVASVPTDPLLMFTTAKGLRSVPYLVLCDTAMTETCALHLSYIVEGHYLPGRLLARVPPVKAGPPAQQIMAYDESQCRGIIYHSNPQVGHAGLKVLQLAESKRDQQHCDSDDLDRKSLSDPSEPSESPMRARKPTFMPSIAATAKRRGSTQRGALDDSTLTTELDRARSRIQGNTLQEAGPCSNDLWRAALKMLAIGRYWLPQTSRRLPIRSPAPAPEAPRTIIKTLTIPGVSKSKVLKPLTPLTVEKDPNRPVNPWNTDFRKKNEGIPATPSVIPPTPLHLKTGSEVSKTAAEDKPLPAVEQADRTKLPCGLPEHAWAKILGHIVGAEGILSDDQQLSVMRYALDRKTLGKEREALGLTSATQIWRILEVTGCLGYEMDV